MDSQQLKRLQLILQPFMLRRTKKDVLDELVTKVREGRWSRIEGFGCARLFSSAGSSVSSMCREHPNVGLICGDSRAVNQNPTSSGANWALKPQILYPKL